MIKVTVVKNGAKVGWFKDLNAGVQVIKTTCELNKFDIREYQIRDYDSGLVLWCGEKNSATSQNDLTSV